MRFKFPERLVRAIKVRSTAVADALQVRGYGLPYALIAFYSALTAFYFSFGLYPLEQPAGPSALFGITGVPTLAGKIILAGVVLAFCGALVVAGVLTAFYRSRRAGAAGACVAGAFVLFAVTLAGYQQYLLKDRIPTAAALVASFPAIALLIWTVLSAERHAHLFSGWSARADRLVLELSRRKLLGRTGVFWVVAAAAVLICVGFIDLALNQYLRLAPRYDTAVFENIFFHTLRGKIGWESIDRVLHLGVHFTPTLALLLPAYAVFPRAPTLLVLESVFLVLGAIPLWWLAARVTRSVRAAYIFALAYLLFPHTIGMNIHGFKELCLWPLMGFTYLCLIEQPGFQRRPGFWFFLLLTLGLKEEFALTLAALSLVHWLQGRSRAGHVAVIAVCAVWFVGVTQWVMPTLLGPAGHPVYGKGWLFVHYYADMVPWGSKSLVSYALNALLHPSLTAATLTRPQVIKFLFDISLPLLFLPWFGGLTLIALIPSLFFTNLLATNIGVVSTLSSYITYVVPWFYCALYGWTRVRGRLERWEAFGQRGFLYVMLGIGLLGLTQNIRMPEPVTPQETQMRHWLESRPVELRIMASRCFLVYLSGRDSIRTMNPGEDLSQLDMVIVQSVQRYCTWTDDNFREVRKAVLATGDFVEDPSPLPGIVVYRRTRPAQ